ncbi:STAS domain-containing protein [Aliamphritea ceti]|uniref:STAS domain-containing protein n=1 Tax=Aliamphritea ceti TaxID=1524258 RepID=UPI0021C3488C|nr:STAS domain-containing protein [Aliamphritea ceti]
MATFSCKQESADTLVLSGDLVFATSENARQVTNACLDALKGNAVVDFSGINRVDSSALAYWLSCLRVAEQSNAVLEARNFPDEMVQMAELVGISATRIWK